MCRNRVLEKLRKHKSVFDKKGITHLYLFGSFARGEDNLNSDLNLIIDYDSSKNKITLFDLSDIEEDLKKTFGIKKIDIVTKKAINNRLIKYIEKDILQVY